MFETALIVFREVLEAALVVSIVAAAIRGLAGRRRLLASGIGAGIVGALLVAAFAGEIARLASGVGQSLFDAAVLLAAAGLIGWHVLWMSRHGRDMAMSLKAVSRSVVAGDRPPLALTLVVALAILREGSEVVLFVYGLAAGGVSPAALAAGGLVGLACGVGVGVALYFGLLQIPTGRLFAISNWILLVVAAGMAAQAGGFLVGSDVLPALGNQIWNSGALVADNSTAGRLLHALVGYTARPSGMQILLFAVTLLGIGGGSLWLRRHAAARPPSSTLSGGVRSS